MVYFVQPKNGGSIKIGWTRDLTRRWTALEKEFGEELVVLRVVEGDREHEQALHKRFAKHRIGKTEHFIPAKALLKYINSPNAKEASGPVAPRKTRYEGLVGVKVNCGVAHRLRMIAKMRKTTVAELFEEICGPVIEAALFDYDRQRIESQNAVRKSLGLLLAAEAEAKADFEPEPALTEGA